MAQAAKRDPDNPILNSPDILTVKNPLDDALKRVATELVHSRAA